MATPTGPGPIQPSENPTPKSDAVQPVQDTRTQAQTQANSTMLREVNNAGEASSSSPEAFLSDSSVFTNKQPGSSARAVADDASKGAGVSRPQDATFGNMQGTYSRGSDLFTSKEGERYRVTQKPDNSYELQSLKDQSKITVSQAETKFNTSDINAPGGSKGPATVKQFESGGARPEASQPQSDAEARIQAAKNRAESVRTATNEGGDPRAAYKGSEQQVDRTSTNKGTTEGGQQNRVGAESQSPQNRQTVETGQQKTDQQTRTTNDGATRSVPEGQTRADQIRNAIAGGADASTLRNIYAQGNTDGTSQAKALTSGKQQEGVKPPQGENQTRSLVADNQTRPQGADNQTRLQAENQARLQGDGKQAGQNEGLRKNAGGETTSGTTTQPRNDGATKAAEIKQAIANGADANTLRQIYANQNATESGGAKRTTTDGTRTTTGAENQTRPQGGETQVRQGGETQVRPQGENQARLQGDGKQGGQNEGLRRNAGGETNTGTTTTQPRPEGATLAQELKQARASGADPSQMREIYNRGTTDSGAKKPAGEAPRTTTPETRTTQPETRSLVQQGGETQPRPQAETQPRLQGDSKQAGQNEGLRRNAGGETTTGTTNTQPRPDGATLAQEIKQARASGADPSQLREIYNRGTTDSGAGKKTTTPETRTTTPETRNVTTPETRVQQPATTDQGTQQRKGNLSETLASSNLSQDQRKTFNDNLQTLSTDQKQRLMRMPEDQQKTAIQDMTNRNFDASKFGQNRGQEVAATPRPATDRPATEQRPNQGDKPNQGSDKPNQGDRQNLAQGPNQGQNQELRQGTRQPQGQDQGDLKQGTRQVQTQGQETRQGQGQGQTELTAAQRIEQAKARTEALRSSDRTDADSMRAATDLNRPGQRAGQDNSQGQPPGQQRKGDGGDNAQPQGQRKGDGGQDVQGKPQDRRTNESGQEIAARRNEGNLDQSGKTRQQQESQTTQFDQNRGRSQNQEQKPADVKPADVKPADPTRGTRFNETVNNLNDSQRQNFQNNFGKLNEQQQRSLQDLDGRQQQKMIERLAGDRVDSNKVGRMIDGASDAQQRRANGQENRALENQLTNLEQRNVKRGPDATAQDQSQLQNKPRTFEAKDLDPRTMERLRQTMDGGGDGKLNRGDMERLAKLNPEFREALKNPEFRKALEGSEQRRQGENVEGKQGQLEGRDGRRGEVDGKSAGKEGSNQQLDGKTVDGKLAGKDGAQLDVKGQVLDGKAQTQTGDAAQKGAVDAQGRPIDQLLRALQKGENFKIPGLDLNDPQTKQFLLDAVKRLDNVKVDSPESGSMKLQDIFKGLDVQKSTALQNFLTKGLDASGQPLTVAQLDQARLDMLKTLLQPDGGAKTLADSSTITKNALQMLLQNQKGDLFASTHGDGQGINANSGLTTIGKMLADMNRQFLSDTGKPIQLNDIANRNLLDSTSTDARLNYQRMQQGDLTAKMTPQQDQLVRNLLENSSRLVNALEAGRIANTALKGTDGSIARTDLVGPGRSDTATGRADISTPAVPRADLASRPTGTTLGDGSTAIDASAKPTAQQSDATAPGSGGDLAAKGPASRGDTGSSGMSVADNISRMPIDAATGLPYDPYTGKLLDPSTGLPIGDRSADGVKKTANANAEEDWKNDKDRKKQEKLEGDEEKAERAKQKAMLLMLQAKQKRDQELREKELKEKKRKEEESKRSQYVCKDGDTIESIASKVVKDPRTAPLIYQINKEIIPVSTNILGKEVVNLHAGLTLWLPSPAEVREFKTQLMSEQIDRGEGGKQGSGKFGSAEEELAAKFGANWAGGVDQSKAPGATTDSTTQVAETYAPSSIELDLMTKALAETKKRKENIEKALGPIVPSGNKYKTASDRINYVIRLGDSLKSISSKHPALNDVSLWKLLAEVNNLQPEARLTRGASILIPSVQDIQEYKERLGLTKADKLKRSVENLPSDVELKTCATCQATNVTRSTMCANCGDEYIDGPVESAEPVDAGRLVLEAAGMVPPAAKPARKLSDDPIEVPELTNDVSPNDVPVKTEFLVPEVSAPISGIRTTVESSNPRDQQDQTVAVQPIAWVALKELDSVTSLVKSADSWVAAQEADKAFCIRLQVFANGEWKPVVEYEIHKSKAIRHNFSPDGSSRSVTIELPAQAATEMAQNDLSKNWTTYKAKFGI